MSEMVYKVAEAIAKELATMRVNIVLDMAKDIKDNKPHDCTPFNLLAIAALKELRNNMEYRYEIDTALEGFE